MTVSKGSNGMQNSDDVVYIPMPAMKRYLSGTTGISMVYVEAAIAGRR